MVVAKSYWRGYEIEFVNGEWIYCDTKESTIQTDKDRLCGYCNKSSTQEGHDGCLGTLKGIMNACCGHGQSKEAYVQFLDGHSVHGEDARTILNILKQPVGGKGTTNVKWRPLAALLALFKRKEQIE